MCNQADSLQLITKITTRHRNTSDLHKQMDACSVETVRSQTLGPNEIKHDDINEEKTSEPPLIARDRQKESRDLERGRAAYKIRAACHQALFSSIARPP